MPTDVTLADSRKVEPTELRRRPLGYLVMRGAKPVAERLALNEVLACEVVAPARLEVESYHVTRVKPLARRESINPDQSMQVALSTKTVEVPAGALWVPMEQAAAGVVAAALEPDSPGSYLGVGVIPMADDETEAPLYRVMSTQGLSLTPCR